MTTGRQAKEHRASSIRAETSVPAVQGEVALQGQAAEAPSMKAVLQNGYGSADVLSVGHVARPIIAPDEVLVRVHAAGLDRGTWHIMTGLPYALRLAFGFRTPKNPVPGLDLAGTVEAVGARVTRFAIGDHVFGVGKGSFAEYASARESQLAHKPASISFEQAAVVPVSACTALQALRAAGVEPNSVDPAATDPASAGASQSAAGKKVLVTGASGGVGSYAVQFAKAAGAEVTAVCSAAKMELVRSLGADHVIDYATRDFASGAVRYDVIIDIAGNPTLKRLRRALTPTGTAVITGGEEGGSWTGSLDRQFRALALSWFIRQKLTMVVGSEGSADLGKIAGLLEAGVVVPAIDQAFPLERVPQAMRYFDAGKVRGKIAIVMVPTRTQ